MRELLMASFSPKKSSKQQTSVARKLARLNFKAIGILGIVFVLVVISMVVLKSNSNKSIKISALAQSKESLDRNDYELGLRHLDRYLSENPNDIEVLEAKANLLSKTAGSVDRIQMATQVHDQLIRLDPDGKDRLATRRRLIELYLRYGELVRIFADDINDSRIEAKESRYLAAVEAANELIHYKDKKTGIENGTIDASAHRLKAMAYMGQVPGLVAKNPEQSVALDQAEKELDKALEINPGDIISSEKLAELYMIHRRNPAQSEKTLDRMLDAVKTKKFETESEAKVAMMNVRLSRFRAFYSTRDMTKAQKELESALELAPNNIEILTWAAGLALQRNETLECRRYLDAIPLKFQKDNLKIRLLRGELEFAERHPDEAIDQWRKGLSLVGGGDLDLTWRLAANLIQFSRLTEAKPLIDQYLRLSKPNDPRGIYLEGMYAEKSGRITKAIELMSKASNLVPTAFKSDVMMSLGHCYELIGEENRAMYTYKSAANLGGAAIGPRRAMARLYLASNPNRAIEELEIAYAASKSSGQLKIFTADGCSCVLLPDLKEVSQIPSKGQNQFILADVNHVLHFRLFDLEGRAIVDTDEKRLKEKAGQIGDLRDLIQKLRPPHKISQAENEHANAMATSIVEQTIKEAKGDPNILIDLIKIKLERQMKLAKPERDFREVARLLVEAREIAPSNPAIQGLTAQYQANENRLDLAVKTLEDTIKGTNRKRPEAWLAYAEALELLGRLTDAVNVLDQGSANDVAGDHASLRTMKARILLKMGSGSRAREVLTTNLESIPIPERPELQKALGDLLQELGDRTGASAAYIEWSRLAPESPFPALKLLSIAQLDGDEPSAKAGLEALWKLGRQNEPYALAARALQLLRANPSKPGPIPPDRLAEAEKLVDELNLIAPDFPVKYMIQGMILELRADPSDPKKWRDYLSKAGEAYRKSIKVGTSSPALPKLIEIYMKLKDDDKLNLLKIEYDDGTRRLKTEISVEFDRLSTMIALKIGDKERAAAYLKKIVESRPGNREARIAEANLLAQSGKIQEAENTLLDLVKAQSQDPLTWFELIRFQTLRRTPAIVARTVEMARQRYTGLRPELFLAQCYFSAKDLVNANKEFQKVLDLYPDDLIILRSVVEFREATNQGAQSELLLRKILKLDPTSTWAKRTLALRLSTYPETEAWDQAWSLIAPGTDQAGDFPEDRLIRATVLARSQLSAKRAEAIPAFAALANDLPLSNPVGIEARLRISQAMLELDRSADAWQYINPLCDDLTRSNMSALAIGIEALARLGKGDEADLRLNRIKALVPDSVQVAVSQAWVYHAQGKKEAEAATLLGVFEKHAKAADGEAVGSVCLDLLLKFKDLDAALKIAQQMATLWPARIGSLARVQVARREYDEALLSCQQALEKGSPREALQAAITSVIHRPNDPAFLKKVEEICIRGRAKAPTDFAILVQLATLRHIQQRFEDEMVFYRMALELKPSNRQFLNNMAWTLSEGLNKPEEAYTLVDDLIKRDGPASQFLDTRGVIQIRRGNYQKAIDDLEQAVKTEPSATLYFHLARAYYKAGKLMDSRRCRDLAMASKFDFKTLDATDKMDLDEVMGKP
jgi:tetratricopeptide (TPR) repeat protein